MRGAMPRRRARDRVLVRSGAVAHAPRFRLRTARLDDIPVLVRLRSSMMRDIGRSSEPLIRRHEGRFSPWLRAALRARRITGLLAQDPTGRVVGCGLLWLQPRPPSPRYPFTEVPYVLSMYTVPEWRGRGIATAIVRRFVHQARRLGYPRVELHATEAGRPVYARVGFEPTDQMRLELGRGSSPRRAPRRHVAPARRRPTTRGRSRS